MVTTNLRQVHSSSPDGSLDTDRFRLVVATILLNVSVVGMLTWVPGSNWRTGLALNLLDNVVLWEFVRRRLDRTLAHLLILGLVVGIVELVADAWLVLSTRTLDYSVGGGPMLLQSPIWMPLAWQIVVVQFAVVGERLRRWHAVWGVAVAALLGAVNIPYYEEMARRIHWWTYSGCRMISGTPYYIILGEAWIAAGFAYLNDAARRQRWTITLLAGIAGGLLIFIAYVAAFAITDRAF